MSRTKKITRKISAKTNEEVKGLIIISVSLIILISLYTKAPGIIGLYVKNFILGLTGVLSPAVPIILIIIALDIMSHERIMKKSKLIKFYFIDSGRKHPY